MEKSFDLSSAVTDNEVQHATPSCKNWTDVLFPGSFMGVASKS